MISVALLSVLHMEIMRTLLALPLISMEVSKALTAEVHLNRPSGLQIPRLTLLQPRSHGSPVKQEPGAQVIPSSPHEMESLDDIVPGSCPERWCGGLRSAHSRTNVGHYWCQTGRRSSGTFFYLLSPRAMQLTVYPQPNEGKTTVVKGSASPQHAGTPPPSDALATGSHPTHRRINPPSGAEGGSPDTATAAVTGTGSVPGSS
ncbi:hypothetical protein H0H93_003360 [Arthromyces matolae]|nr:hypothetical protein H0H93_003360 [Arthromyces matolae]